MSGRVFFLILSLMIREGLCDFKVHTFLQYLSNTNSVTVTCQHNGLNEWQMGARLKNEKGNVFCLTKEQNVNDNDNSTQCSWTKEANQFRFIFKKQSFDVRKVQCEVHRNNPLPILVGVGEQTSAFPVCSEPGPTTSGMSPCICLDPENKCSQLAQFLTWALFGLVILLSVYSLMVTGFYIRLRINRSEELYDRLTYVPMQQSQARPKKKVKRNDVDKNTEYMDMREVHQQAGTIRDMNYNSQPIPYRGLTV